ncbi:gp29 [Synechococcus phage syn9]|uniref:Gp29 n=1 Tax=Synechococcus phage syn9 TaxID=382359 RepID=Q0QZJ9_BPSYS|nr:gp29 [Synechococcus phage syn9]ABA46998.1 gp29 [Synechococcus phage syn9]AGH56636.1 hypothetical protein CPUG_00144 [Cyanophage Syn10]
MVNYKYPLYAPWWKVELGKMTPEEIENMKKQHATKSGDTYEWEETDEVRKAVERLHDTIRKLEKEAPDYGIGK